MQVNGPELLPGEVFKLVLSYLSFQEEISITGVSRFFYSAVKNDINDKLKPEVVIHLLSQLKPNQITNFLDYFRNTNAYKNLNLKSSFQTTMSPLELICYALTTNDINNINPDLLESAVKSVQENNPYQIDLNLLKNLNLTILVIRYAKASEENDILEKHYFLNKIIDTCETIVPSFINLAKANLKNIKLAHCNLSRINAEYANLTNSTLEHVKIQDANLRHAILDGCLITLSDLTGTNLLNISIGNPSLISLDYIKISTKFKFTQFKSVLGNYFHKQNDSEDFPFQNYDPLEKSYTISKCTEFSVVNFTNAVFFTNEIFKTDVALKTALDQLFYKYRNHPNEFVIYLELATQLCDHLDKLKNTDRANKLFKIVENHPIFNPETNIHYKLDKLACSGIEFLREENIAKIKEIFAKWKLHENLAQNQP